MFLNADKTVAIIPARGDSRAIPQKNIIDFCGKPLIGWTIEQAKASRYIRDVYVTTDNEEIKKVSTTYGAQVISRPKALATDTASSEEALLHAISEIEKKQEVECVVFLQCTSPLRESQDVDDAVRVFYADGADSLFSAALLEDFCVWGKEKTGFKSITFDYKNRGRRQDREPHYLENGSIYVFKPQVIKDHLNRLGGKIAVTVMPFWKSYEIDGPEDIPVCEYFMKTRLLSNKQDGRLDLSAVRLIVYDFDGVLTDNRVLLREDGVESVFVNRSDGLAVEMIKRQGLKQLILSKEKNPVVLARARKLDIPVLNGIQNKTEALRTYCEQNDISPLHVLYIGNDLNDVEVMKSVGWPFAPCDACDEVKRISKAVLNTKGGGGVVRELLDMLKFQNGGRS